MEYELWQTVYTFEYEVDFIYAFQKCLIDDFQLLLLDFLIFVFDFIIKQSAYMQTKRFIFPNRICLDLTR